MALCDPKQRGKWPGAVTQQGRKERTGKEARGGEGGVERLSTSLMKGDTKEILETDRHTSLMRVGGGGVFLGVGVWTTLTQAS